MEQRTSQAQYLHLGYGKPVDPRLDEYIEARVEGLQARRIFDGLYVSERPLQNLGPLTSSTGATAPGIATAYALSNYIQTPPDQVLSGETMLGAAPVIDWVRDTGVYA